MFSWSCMDMAYRRSIIVCEIFDEKKILFKDERSKMELLLVNSNTTYADCGTFEYACCLHGVWKVLIPIGAVSKLAAQATVPASPRVLPRWLSLVSAGGSLSSVESEAYPCSCITLSRRRSITQSSSCCKSVLLRWSPPYILIQYFVFVLCDIWYCLSPGMSDGAD